MSAIKKHLSSAQIIILGFIFVILLGTILLMMPISTKNGNGTPFLDALFTSTSAVCVTGLIVHDTATYFSSFGHIIIISLIQIGGMGVITIAIIMSIIAGKQIGLKERSTMQEAISAHKVGGIVKLTGFIIKASIMFELLGAFVMMPTFCKEFGIKGIWYGIFHSISAFCNAGFDLMGVKEKFSSVTYFYNDISINVTIASLIIIGGIGFITWDDVKNYRFHFKKYRMQSKVILVTTSILIIVPAVYFYIFEFNNFKISDRILLSIFQAVTPRTAGFNTISYDNLSEASKAIMIVLMLIGGSPGSTAGGMKTTTIAIMVSNALSVFNREKHPHFFGRRVGDDALRQAATVFMIYITLFLFSGIIISRVENIDLLTSLFETASSIGTVGLTLGITTKLSIISKVILIILMYIGRVGSLTLIFSAFSKNPKSNERLPEEKITVG